MSVREGYKMTELGEIPIDWTLSSFKEISKVRQGLQIAIEDRFKLHDKNRYKYITLQY